MSVKIVNDELDVFDVIKNINSKNTPLTIEPHQKLNTFVMTRAYSNTLDSVLQAQIANDFTIDSPQMTYDFYYHMLPRNTNRWSPWNKKPVGLDREYYEVVKLLYGYSKRVADIMYETLKPHLPALYAYAHVSKGGK